MTIEKVTVDDAKKLLEIYTPYITDTAITFEYEIPNIPEFETRIKNISEKIERTDFAYCNSNEN